MNKNASRSHVSLILNKKRKKKKGSSVVPRLCSYVLNTMNKLSNVYIISHATLFFSTTLCMNVTNIYLNYLGKNIWMQLTFTDIEINDDSIYACVLQI